MALHPPPMPHPILKRSASSPHSPHSSVHFPPSPTLTRTFSAHSPSAYDRSPIVVSPNSCALPARGCPGRTYYDECRRRKSAAATAKLPPRGHLHPRALAAYQEDVDEDDADEDDDEAERTPTRTSPYIPLPVPPPIPGPYAPQYNSYAAPPPLIPDLSSESDESDGFTSPPPEPAVSFLGPGGKYPYPYPSYPSYPSYPQSASYPAHPTYPSYPSYPAPPSYPSYPSPPASAPSSYPQYPAQQQQYPSTAPTSPSYTATSSPLALAKRRPRRASPRRSASGAGPRDGYEEEDLDLPPRLSVAPPQASPPRASKSRSSSSTSTKSSPDGKPRSRDGGRDKEGKPRKGSDKDREKCRVSALCRSLAGVGFGGDAEGCLGGF
ncbi:hypothetical protein C8R44DRAFT_972943 [Mycena epipterygia]|nr:hypothetical protein C8R44DRAFT_972943 [Mycena epipterygia]